MAKKTYADLQTQRAEIENATIAGENTASRVGQMFEDSIDSLIIPFGSSVGINTYTFTMSPTVASYTDGGLYLVRILDSSTGAVTFNFDSVGAKKVLGTDGEQFTDGYLKDNVDYLVSYNSALDSAVGAFVVINYNAIVGVQDFHITASAFWPRSSNGCSVLTKREMATSLVNIQSLNFDQTTQEFAQVLFRFPKKYNLGTLTYEIEWTSASGAGTVQWGVSGRAYSNDDPLTAALGTAVTVDDTLLAVDDNHTTPVSAAVTLAGTPAVADLIVLQISRNPGSDTLTADAEFLGICLHITTNAANDI